MSDSEYEDHAYCMILTTYTDEKVGESIIKSLLEKKLAACIQVQEIKSYYHWKGKVNADNERLLYIKTKKTLYDAVEKEILSLHDYETPEIIAVPISKGFRGYLDWVNEECLRS